MITCRSCSGNKVEQVLDLGEQPWGNDFIKIDDFQICEKYPLRLFFCHSCSMVQIDYTVPKEKMFVDHSYMSGTTKSLKNHFVDIGKSILEKFDIENGCVLDIGGNDGTFLEFFDEKNIKVLNVESGLHQAEQSSLKGIETYNTFFNFDTAQDIEKKYGPIKIIHGSGVLFHLEELHSVFRGIEYLLGKNGILVAEFIYLPDMVKNCAYDQIYHEHLLYYSLNSFQNLLDQFNLEVFDAQLKPIHGGSCIAYIAKKNTYNKTTNLQKLILSEYNLKVNDIDIYKKFASNSFMHKKIMQKLIYDLKQSNKTIHALGAPVKGSTIINFCEINEEQIDCAVEINPHKFNTFIPGTKIPVYDESKVDQPDVYLLLAWNFTEEILPRFEEFRSNGGQFIIPIPTPKLV